MPTSTSSFRVDAELKLRLELAARRTNRGKNWIINQALSEYLSHHAESDLQAEARRQSLEAARRSANGKALKESQGWEQTAAEVWNE
jgi:predicted transcriptional regulator